MYGAFKLGRMDAVIMTSIMCYVEVQYTLCMSNRLQPEVSAELAADVTWCRHGRRWFSSCVIVHQTLR